MTRMTRVVLLLCLLGTAVAAPGWYDAKVEPLIKENSEHVKDAWAYLSHLLTRIKEIIDAQLKAMEGHCIMTILNLFGLSAQDLTNALDKLEETADEIAKELTLEEKIKLENASKDFLLMVNDGNFRLGATLEDLHTMKTVLHPHLGPASQTFLDTTEQFILTVMKLFRTI